MTAAPRLAVGLVAGSCFAAAVPGVSAQTTEAPSAARADAGSADSLSFKQAVGIALERSPVYEREVNAVASAGFSERLALGRAFLPSLSAGLGFGGGWSRRQTGEDDFGQPIEGTEFREATSSSASQSVNASVPLFDLQSIRSYGAAQDRTAARAAAAEYQAGLLRTRVGQAYFGVVQRDRLVEVEERNLATARQSLEAIRRLLRIAARQPTDVLGAELQVAQAEQALAEARGEARKARLQLRARLGVPLERAFVLTTGFADVFDPEALQTETLVRRALEDSPRIAQQVASLKAAEASLSAERAGRYPSISGNVGYSRSFGIQGYDAIGRFDLPNQGWDFGFSLSLPVFSQFGTSAAIGQADIAVDDARAALREARLQLDMEVRSALIDLRNAYASVVLAERQVELGRERLAQGQELYRLGTLDYTDLQTMIDQLSGYERGLITARYRFTEALLTLEEKVGGTVGGTAGG